MGGRFRRLGGHVDVGHAGWGGRWFSSVCAWRGGGGGGDASSSRGKNSQKYYSGFVKKRKWRSTILARRIVNGLGH